MQDCAAQCSVEESSRMLPCCSNGHSMHLECMQALINANTEDYRELRCPLCRDDMLDILYNMFPGPDTNDDDEAEEEDDESYHPPADETEESEDAEQTEEPEPELNPAQAHWTRKVIFNWDDCTTTVIFQ